MDGADEADFLELLVANNRIGEWIERLRARGNPSRQKQALLLLKQAVESRSTYAEEARQAGVVPLLTRLLGLTEDEEVLDACSAIIAACSGPMATAGKLSTYTYDGAQVHIREGALGDGLGAKVWMVAHMLCLELASNRGLLAGRSVLELGSGCGVCGLAAAALGAEHVVLTDVEGPVLRNLRSCMHLNQSRRDSGRDGSGQRGDGGASAEASGHGQAQQRQQQQDPQHRGAVCGLPGAIPTDEELFDEAEEVEDFDGMLCEMAGGCSHGLEGGPDVAGGAAQAVTAQGQQRQGPHADVEAQQSWDAGNTSVRFLDWAESMRFLDAAAGGDGAPPAAVAAAAGAAAGQRQEDDLPPRVPAEQRFPVIIGSEVMYERIHAELVAAVVKHRLAPGGCALLHCAVREVKVFQHFARECRRRGLRYRHRAVDPAAAFGSQRAFEGILGRADEYEGGFLLMALDHVDSPCTEWYRDDWEATE